MSIEWKGKWEIVRLFGRAPFLTQRSLFPLSHLLFPISNETNEAG
jgi:hypothetical protein